MSYIPSLSSTPKGLSDIIYGAYPSAKHIGYTERVERLVPVSPSWLGRLWLAIRGRQTHHMAWTPGVCKFTVLHCEPLNEDDRAATFATIEDYRPAGVIIEVEWMQSVEEDYKGECRDK